MQTVVEIGKQESTLRRALCWSSWPRENTALDETREGYERVDWELVPHQHWSFFLSLFGSRSCEYPLTLNYTLLAGG